MPGVVIDASALVAVLTTDRRGQSVDEAVRGRSLSAPSLLHLEVLHSLRGLELGRRVTADEALSASRQLFRVPVRLAATGLLVDRIWELRVNLTAYDAAYVALAERLDVPLVTLDEHVARASGPRCDMVVPR